MSEPPIAIGVPVAETSAGGVAEEMSEDARPSAGIRACVLRPRVGSARALDA